MGLIHALFWHTLYAIKIIRVFRNWHTYFLDYLGVYRLMKKHFIFTNSMMEH